MTAPAAALDFSHVGSKSAHRDVYPPSMPDTQLLLNVLREERAILRTRRVGICLEVGCGAAPAAALLAQLLPAAASFATDISASAVLAADETCRRNQVSVLLARMDLVAALRPGIVDVLVFHPPYVPTDQALLDDALHDASTCEEQREQIDSAAWTWAGGPGGRQLVDRIVGVLDVVLSPSGVFYLLFFDPEQVREVLDAHGFTATVVASWTDKADRFAVLRCLRADAADSWGR